MDWSRAKVSRWKTRVGEAVAAENRFEADGSRYFQRKSCPNIYIYPKRGLSHFGGKVVRGPILPHKDLWKPGNSLKWMVKTNTVNFKAFNSLVEVSIARKYVYRIPHMSFFSFCLMKITHHPKNPQKKLHHGCPTMLTIPHLSPTKDEVAEDQNGFVRHVLNAHLGHRASGANIRYGAAGTLGKHRVSLLLTVPSLTPGKSWRQGGILFEVLWIFYPKSNFSKHPRFLPLPYPLKYQIQINQQNQTPCLSYIPLFCSFK